MTLYEKSREMICVAWQENLKNFSEEHSFPEEAEGALERALKEICENNRLFELFRSYEERYWENPSIDYEGLWRDLRDAGEEGIPEYTLDLLFLIGISRRTRELYEERGISGEIFHDSMDDLRCKLLECHRMYGIWGTFVADWFPWWFELKRFALGRLQFELISFRREYEREGLKLHPDSQVINVHIPSRGPLDPEDCRKSYEKAAEFYREAFEGKPIVFVCNSWLLYPAHREILPERSNIRAFLSNYDVYETVESKEDLWRIFYGAEEKGYENLPENSSLERAYKRWLLAGNPVGHSRGVYLWTGC